jgi:hypothetical protein
MKARRSPILSGAELNCCSQSLREILLIVSPRPIRTVSVIHPPSYRFGAERLKQAAAMFAIRLDEWFASPVNVFSMTYFYYPNCKFVILDGVYNAIVPLTYAIFFLAG